MNALDFKVRFGTYGLLMRFIFDLETVDFEFSIQFYAMRPFFKWWTFCSHVTSMLTEAIAAPTYRSGISCLAIVSSARDVSLYAQSNDRPRMSESFDYSL